MAILFLALLILVPLVEISVFIEVGGRIGPLTTIGITVLTAIAGLYLVRLEGLAVLIRMRHSMAMGEVPIVEMFHGFFLFLAGILLLIPGFVSDVIGGLLLIPIVRSLLARPAVTRILTGHPHPATYRNASGRIIIEGSYREEGDEDNEPQPLIESDDDGESRE
jgi:UPF0716 protein FxsA